MAHAADPTGRLASVDVVGIVICDFNTKQCLQGFEDWLTDHELLGGGMESCVKTEKLGYVHYSDPNEGVRGQIYFKLFRARK